MLESEARRISDEELVNLMSFSILIPARFGSTRLPGKPLIKLGNRTLIQRVYRIVLTAVLRMWLLQPMI